MESLYLGQGMITHIVNEHLPPSLVLPGEFCGTFKSYEKLSLEVEEFVEVREEEVYRVLVNHVAL